MHRPGFGPGSPPWQGSVLPLDYRCVMYLIIVTAQYKNMQERPEWREFEERTGDIFEELGYDIMRNVNFKTTRRYQIDLIAFNRVRAFFVDCKDHFYIPPSKEENFMIEQVARMKNYVETNASFAWKNNVALLVTKYRTSSLINHKEGVGKILAVDINSLNELLSNLPVYESELLSFKGIL